MSTDERQAGLPNGAIYFPLDQAEQAFQPNTDRLLPLEVYRRLEGLIRDAVPVRAHQDLEAVDFHAERRHNSVLIDGDRGTGKSTVIVNLASYLQRPEPGAPGARTADLVHILKPIDPSQLEDTDDLFLNVVVAAVLSDTELRSAQERSPDDRKLLHDRLQALGIALEGRQGQSSDRGLDRLRNFMGSQALALAIHRFFAAALKLLNKKLLVMPIDDVDTTLHRAFENLEVVRRYLATPLVLPIICGDVGLFDEVIWRDAHRRLTKDAPKVSGDDAVWIAKDFAREYERKLMPLQARLRMPSVDSLLRNRRILLGTSEQATKRSLLPLTYLHAWLKVLLAGPVNELENSRLDVPVRTVRALAQLVGSVRTAIPELEIEYAKGEAVSTICRLMQRVAEGISGTDPTTPAHLESSRPVSAGVAEETAKSPLSLVDLQHRWAVQLLEHFRHEPAAGEAYLVLAALRHWREEPRCSVLDTPLFQPLEQASSSDFVYFEKKGPMNWGKDLDGRLPEAWLDGLPLASIVSFEVPEPGLAVPGGDYRFSENEVPDPERRIRFNLMVDLLLHRHYYTAQKRSPLVCIGRVLELVIASLIRDLTVEQVELLLSTAPYHSAAAVAATKTLVVGGGGGDADDDEQSEASATNVSVSADESRRAVGLLVSEVNAWRRQVELADVLASPWLVYHVLNKTLNQAWFFNKPRSVGAQPAAIAVRDVAWRVRVTFNALWAAFGSFEKGPLFGLPPVISTVNVGAGTDFERSDAYRMNILPFVAADFRKDGPQSVTRMLRSHPLKSWVADLPRPEFELNRDDASLYAQLDLIGSANPTIEQIQEAIVRNAQLSSLNPLEFGKELESHLLDHGASALELGLLTQALYRVRT